MIRLGKTVDQLKVLFEVASRETGGQAEVAIRSEIFKCFMRTSRLAQGWVRLFKD
jgi:hypothetical protein